ncbi:hypothetical protein CEXT_792531 [Caerostris extrusa]|uniref:Uncharacterized protein n=1 Tax=Caerostris extrusa TaxID=172846 RepID=A0AAV4VUD3_CAEEX|nr:hypothetical protein CEXT_792531 [Caerostris extrusa]
MSMPRSGVSDAAASFFDFNRQAPAVHKQITKPPKELTNIKATRHSKAVSRDLPNKTMSIPRAVMHVQKRATDMRKEGTEKNLL